MATIDELHAALIKADAAGDKVSAKALADHIREMSSQAPARAGIGDFIPGFAALKEGVGQGVINYALGGVKGKLDQVAGASQLLLHGVNAATNGSLDGITKRYDTFLSDKEKQYQDATPGSIAAGVGRGIGNLTMPIPAIGGAAIRGAGLVNGLKTVGAASATGGLIGAAQPVYSTPDSTYAQTKGMQIGGGALVGGMLSSAGSVAGAAYNTIRPIVSPSSTVGNQIYNGLSAVSAKGGSTELEPSVNALMGSSNAADVVARIRASKQFVPGSLPTTAQVAGVPELVMAEKTLKNNPNYRGPFEDRSIANNSARMAVLRDVASTPEALQAAQKARGEATKPLYDAAYQQTHSIDERMQSILNRPSAQSAISRGQRLAAEEETTALPIAGTAAIPERQQASSVLDANGNPFTTTIPAVPATAGSIDGKTLQYLKMGVQDLQTEGKRQGMGAHESNALTATEGDLHNWIIKNSPDYANADAQYAATSVPVNTMEAGQQLHNVLTEGRALNAAGDVAPTLDRYRSQYAAALKNSPYGIDPTAKVALDSLQNDLQRETISNSIRSAGSDTYFNAQAPNWLSGKLFGANLDGKSPAAMAVGGLLAGHGTLGMATAGGVMGAQKLGQFVGNRVNTRFQKAMLNPDDFAQLLQEAITRNANGGNVNNLAPVQRGAAAFTGNVLSPDR